MKLAILASGGGSTAEPLLPLASLIITNNSTAGIIDRAKKRGVDCILLTRKDYQVFNQKGELDVEKSREKYGLSMLTLFRMYQIDFISQNGWSLLTPSNVVDLFKNRIINSHPAPLDPGFLDFGGQGMHGLAVHQAVLNFKAMIHRPFVQTEVTLHTVTDEYDKGELVGMSKVPILEDDTAQSLQDRVKEIEKMQNFEFWIKIQQKGIVETFSRVERLILPTEELILEEAKRRAIHQFPNG